MIEYIIFNDAVCGFSELIFEDEDEKTYYNKKSYREENYINIESENDDEF